MSKIIIIDEEMVHDLKDMLAMTQFKFKANIKKFLAALLEDPTGAEPDMIFTQNGLDKNKLIKALVDNKVITKKMTIDDHDAEGNPHTAKMIVKYSVPKERFNEKLDALYDILFPDAEGKINEEGAAGGGAASCSGVDGNGFGSGEFVQPLFGGISVRKKKKDKKSVGGNPYTLNENQESKSIDAAKKLYMQRTGRSADEADKFVRVDLRNDIPVLRDRNGGKFILGVTRMFLNGQLRDARMIQNLNKTLKLLVQGHFDEYDRNLNGMSAQDVISRFATAMKQMDDRERDELSSMEFNGNSDYDIVRIDDFKQSSQYGKYTSWCVTHNENMFNSYTSNGIGQFYFCLRNGFESEQPTPGENCPLDSYGLSMVAVSVDENGRLNTCTCRWNHDNGANDNIMGVKEISELIGQNFFEVFKPNGKWQGIVDDAMERLRNGESPEDVFDYCYVFKEGLAIVKLNGKFNWIRQDNGELLSNQWFDYCYNFNGGLAKVILNGKLYCMRKDGVLCDYKTKEPINQNVNLNEIINQVIKRIISEAVTGEDGRKSSAVYAYAKNSNGEWCILAAKRIKNEWDDEGGKMNPPMGHRHKYESPEDGAVRECEEESGIKFDKKDLVLASKEDWGTNFKIYLPGKTSDYKPGEGDEENTKFKWIPVSDIDKYDWAWSCGTFAKRFKPKK